MHEESDGWKLLLIYKEGTYISTYTFAYILIKRSTPHKTNSLIQLLYNPRAKQSVFRTAWSVSKVSLRPN